METTVETTERSATHGSVLTCECCGCVVLDVPDRNSEYGNRDLAEGGRGVCLDCGGTNQPPAVDETEEDARRRLGWAMCAFADYRIPVVRDGLNEAQRKKFDALPYRKKVNVICKCVERGILSW